MEKKYMLLIVIIAVVLIAFVLYMLSKKENMTQTQRPISTMEVALYYSPQCGYCKSFMKDWQEFNEKITKIYRYNNSVRLTTKKINCAENKCEGIAGYPTIMLTKKGKSIQFEGERSVDNLMKFVDKNI